jgi:rSAM/selenodomain-associated transferase 1
MRKPVVIVFARAPQLGRVKTRLARGIGPVGALRFYRLTMFATVRRLARDRRWETRIAATPDGAARASRRWPARLRMQRQGRGDLGQRMLAALAAIRGRPAMVVGCDIPDLDARAVGACLRALAGARVVLGPSGDGGYWLIGVRGVRLARRRLEGVRWSTAHARRDTVIRLAPLAVVEGPELDDVDEVGDLLRLRRRLAS